jgi:hypothetical protein
MGMRVKVNLIGDGEIDNPHRVTLPTYRMIHVDHEEGWAIVEIPEDVHGRSQEHLADETLVPHETGEHHETLSPENVKAIHSHFDDYYREHRGEFRLDFVK